jgi:LysR family transcriptional regulator, hydrogen peroxide-inducible genes activator
MDLAQIGYFLNLAETRNFTLAASRSGVSQPSLTRAIQRLEDELGGLLVHRDGKNTRLTALGQHIAVEFRRVDLALRSARRHSESWAMDRRRVLDIAVDASIGPLAFTDFFAGAMEQLPSVALNIRALESHEAVAEVLSGKYHGCILPQEPRGHRRLNVLRLFRERFMLGCAPSHPLARAAVVSTQSIAAYPFVDRLACEFRSQVSEHFQHHHVALRPRYRAQQEDWVKQMVASGRAVCIMPERSGAAPGVITRPIDGLSLERELVFVTVGGGETPQELHELAGMLTRYDWGDPGDRDTPPSVSKP